MSPEHATYPTAPYLMSGEWESFLQREQLTIDQAQATASLSGKRILITGAGGWIGSALAAAIGKLCAAASGALGSQ